MKREEMNSVVLAIKDKEFQEEVNYYVYGIDDREYPYDPVFAVFDIEDREDQSRKLLIICRRLLIQFGFYRIMPQEEIDSTYLSRGVPWNFKLDGVYYTTDEHASEWQDRAISYAI